MPAVRKRDRGGPIRSALCKQRGWLQCALRLAPSAHEKGVVSSGAQAVLVRGRADFAVGFQRSERLRFIVIPSADNPGELSQLADSAPAGKTRMAQCARLRSRLS